jgi:hypothetical protein
MAGMRHFSIAGWCAGTSALCYAFAMLRGDLICAGDLTGALIGGFFLFAIAAVVFLVIGFVQKMRRRPSSEPISK